ncbi:MAG: A/G-specific adenine glycosylase [Burkholderiales bacterium]
MSKFARVLIAWQRRRGRKGLPWQGTREPYRIWLSEVMLQQTQVAAVIPYYARFLGKYPTVEALAAASEEDVLTLWAGLGYYARGRNLHAAARIIAQRGFPRTQEEIAELPGVGRSTAAAIAAFAFGERAAILDGNVKRVLSRGFGIERQAHLWELAERLLPRNGIEAYTQALMDLGATVCTRTKPRCDECPIRATCVARKEGRVEELPTPRQRKPLPQKEVTWLVLRHGREVLLEKRPSPGIWGGLWCFPEAQKDAKGTLLAPLEHSFTHFRLRIHPLLKELGNKPLRAESPARLWLDLEDAAGAAIPTPVRKLIARLAG